MTAGVHTNVGNAEMPDDHWVGAMGLELSTSGGVVTGRGRVLPSMWAPGSQRLRLGILATLVDLVGGYVPDGPRTPTIDLRVQLAGNAPSDGSIELTGEAKKVGQRLVVSEVVARDANARVFATGTTTFMNQRFVMDELDRELRQVGAIESFQDLLGTRVIDAATLEVDPTPQLSNGPYGTVQGGAQAALAELAGEHLLAGRGVQVVDLDIRYLNRVKVGPLRATANVAGETGPLTSVRVRLSDAGNDDRIVAHVSLLVM